MAHLQFCFWIRPKLIMAPSYFPLRWESTGDQWWYASPIDWAAANGHYDLVRELLHIDPNLLIKLTSLRRIRRLETVWDDDSAYADVARCRSNVARSLLSECEISPGDNSLIKTGYGGWLVYTAASAGDMGFVHDLLQRDPLLVFGEGEFGVTDILYAAARSNSCEVFQLLFDFSMSPRSSRDVEMTGTNEDALLFRSEMITRALHAAARGGSWEILRDLLRNCRDILLYRDIHGSTVLHAAAARGRTDVVKNLVASFDIIDSKDDQGNTSFHVAAFRGHLQCLQALILASPPAMSLTNSMGDTFLHIALAGFRTPGFRRLDRQMDLIKELINGSLVNIEEIVNYRNNEGRTVLHMAVGNLHGELVSLLLGTKSINLNVQDHNGMTPLDLLNKRPRSATSDILIKRLISAGGLSNSSNCNIAKNSAICNRSYRRKSSQGRGILNSPGTSFRISDAEIFLYTGITTSSEGICKDIGSGGTGTTGSAVGSGRPSSCSSIGKNDMNILPEETGETKKKPSSSMSSATSRLKTLLRWPLKREKKKAKTPLSLSAPTTGTDDDCSAGSLKNLSRKEDEYLQNLIRKEDNPTSLRERFSKTSSLQNNKRTLAVRTSTSPSSKKKLTASLTQGVIQSMPHLAPQVKSSSSSSSTPAPVPVDGSSMISASSTEMDIVGEEEPSSSMANSSTKPELVKGNKNTKSRTHYFCFGPHGLNVDEACSSGK